MSGAMPTDRSHSSRPRARSATGSNARSTRPTTPPPNQATNQPRNQPTTAERLVAPIGWPGGSGVGLEVGPGGGQQQSDGGLDAEHGRIEDDVVEGRVARVDP